MLAQGLETEVGERGANLSGGQRARVGLARALYSGGDLLLLDDPLSAIDSEVALSLLQNTFLKHLRHKTRILVTHQLQLLGEVDRIIYLEEGRIKFEGTFEEFKSLEFSQNIGLEIESKQRSRSE